MIKLMMVTPSTSGPICGSMDYDEVNVKKFDTDNVVELISLEFDCGVRPRDLEIDERNDEYITVKVSGIHTDDGEIDVLLIGKRQDYTGEMMS